MPHTLGEVPSLGFEGEHWSDMTIVYKCVLHIPVPKFGVISIYAWSPQVGEGYNIFYPNDSTTPFVSETHQAKSPLEAKLLVHNYFERFNHYIKTGEII